jgi:hypothetical protein
MKSGMCDNRQACQTDTVSARDAGTWLRKFQSIALGESQIFDNRGSAPIISVRPLLFLLGHPHYAASEFTQLGGIAVTLSFFWQRILLFFGIAVVLGACSTGPQITRTQDVSESADTPYKKILVITLLSSFDSRRYLEDEVVLHLAELGTDAVASTSMMNTKTPVTRSTFMAMVEKIDADAVLVTQLASLESKGTMKDMNPQATYNFRPTYYYNVWSVDLEEYVEPQAVEFKHSLVLATQLYSVLNREPVWAIESKSKIVMNHEQVRDYAIIVDEAKAITTHLSRDGLIAR